MVDLPVVALVMVDLFMAARPNNTLPFVRIREKRSARRRSRYCRDFIRVCCASTLFCATFPVRLSTIKDQQPLLLSSTQRVSDSQALFEILTLCQS